MVNQKKKHQGKEINVSAHGDEKVLTIDGEKVPLSRDPDSGGHSTPQLPYLTFEDLQGLAQALIENSDTK